jgi:hypothetical protein
MLEPPPWIVRATFDREKFDEPAGLYLASSYQGDLVSGQEAEPLTHPQSGGIVGGYVGLAGIRFLIWLSREPVKEFEFPQPTGVISPADRAELLYRTETLRFPIRNVVNQKLCFTWA